jgi:hypothetical protein
MSCLTQTLLLVVMPTELGALGRMRAQEGSLSVVSSSFSRVGQLVLVWFALELFWSRSLLVSKIFKCLYSGCRRKGDYIMSPWLSMRIKQLNPNHFYPMPCSWVSLATWLPPRFKCAATHLGPAISHRYKLRSNCFADCDMGIIWMSLQIMLQIISIIITNQACGTTAFDDHISQTILFIVRALLW